MLHLQTAIVVQLISNGSIYHTLKVCCIRVVIVLSCVHVRCQGHASAQQAA